MIISIFSVESKRIELIFSVLIKGYLLTGFFSRYSTHGNPFDYVYVEDEAEDVLAENGVSPVIWLHAFLPVYVTDGKTFQNVC